MPSDVPPGRAARTAPALCRVAIVTGAALAWHGLLRLQLLGPDSYPLILAGRARSLAELVENAGEKLMDGQLGTAAYYRPLVHMSFALDHALWELEPLGYHVTGWILISACGLATFELARRLLGPASLPAAALAGIAFVLHPVHFTVLPFPARRADVLALLWSAVALGILLGSKASPPSLGRRFATALACGLALASKETGLVAYALAAAALALRSDGSAATRARRAAREAWPLLCTLVPLLVARWLVLDGIGGPAAGRAHLRRLERAPEIALSLLERTWLPGLPELGPGAAALGLAGLGALFAVAYLACARAAGRVPSGGALSPPATWALLLMWTLAVLGMTATVGRANSWYAYPLLPSACIALALLVDRGAAAWRAGNARRGAAAIGLALAVAGSASAFGGLFDRGPDLHAGSRSVEEYLLQLERTVHATPRGWTMELGPPPTSRNVTAGSGTTRREALLSLRTVQAYAELRFPERALTVASRRVGSGPTRSRQLVLFEGD